MDVETLIEGLKTCARLGDSPIMDGFAVIADKRKLEDAATVLSTLQAANEKLRAELEQVKSERAMALEHLHGICSACKNYSPYHNRGKCRFCVYEPARNKVAEANDNWEWSGPEKED